MLATLLGLLPLVALFSSPVAAQTDANDIAVLNTALAMANMNSAFFNCFLAPNNASYASVCNSISPMVMGMNSNQFLDAGYPANVYNALLAIGNQEAASAAFLSSAINAASANSAYPACRNYTFSNTTSVVTFLQNGARLMANTLSFYNGGLNGLTNVDRQTIMARLGSVKGRHAAFFNTLLNASFVDGTMNGFDLESAPAVANMSTVAYQLDCSNVPWRAPTIRPYGVSRSSSNTTAYTGPLAQASDVVYGTAARTNDINTMNYFLAIENLAVNYFSNITSTYSAADFTTAGFAPAVYAAVQQMANDDRAHVSAYTALIPAYGGSPYPNCTYNFAPWTTSVNGSLANAQALLNIGVQAYNGRLNAITDTLFQQAAATVATVHARHSALLNMIQSGYTGAFINGNLTTHANSFIGNSMSPSEVISAIGATNVQGNCPVAFPQPGVAPGIAFGSSSSGGFVNMSSSSSGMFSSTGNGASSIGLSALSLIALLPMLLF